MREYLTILASILLLVNFLVNYTEIGNFEEKPVLKGIGNEGKGMKRIIVCIYIWIKCFINC